MASDRARITFDPKQQYRTVVMQQGRASVEADFNDAQTLVTHELRQETLDIVGPRGTPDNGYTITPDTGDTNFQISSGTMYVGGLRVELPPAKPPFTYTTQPDWLNPDPSPAAPQQELIALHLIAQEVSAVEDPDLREVALGGPDTAQRQRILQRIRRIAVSAVSDCQSAFSQAQTQWQALGLNFDPATMRIEPQSTLVVSPVPSGAPSGPCDPSSQSGYLGPDNQMIRVQIAGPGQILWGFDNASFLYQVTVNPSDMVTLTLASSPVDDFHQPIKGQAVEVLRPVAKLNNGAYVAYGGDLESPPPGQYSFPTTLATGYTQDGQTVQLAAALPAAYVDAAQTPVVYLRVWQQLLPFTPGTPVLLGNTGIQVQLATTGQFHIGDFWMFALRPDFPTNVYPERYLTPQPPEGPRQWICPLAVIDWTGTAPVVLEDCRYTFNPLASHAIHVTSINWPNDAPVAIDQFFSQGLQITLDGPPVPATVTSSTMIVTIENASGGAGFATLLIIVAEPAVAANVITWTPPSALQGVLIKSEDNSLRVRVTLKGHVIWANLGGALRYLDGQAFGQGNGPRTGGGTITSLVLPSGSGVRASDFESWFFLTEPRPFTFQSATAVPPNVRAEGITELVGDLVLVGTGGLPTTSGTAVGVFNITVVLNSPVTSPLVGNATDVVLRIDQPTTLNSVDFAQFPPPPLNGVGGAGWNYSNGSAPNIFQGQLMTGGNGIQFNGIPIDPPGSGANRALTISNLRVIPGPASASVVKSVTASVTIQGPSVNQNFAPTSVAFAASALGSATGFSAGNPDNSKPLQPISSKNFNRNLEAALVNFNLEFTGGFPGSLKTQSQENGSFTSAALGVGAATQGTQLSVTFTNVPPGLSIFVTMTDVAVSAGQQPVPPTTPSATMVTSAGPDGKTQTGIPLKLVTIPGTAATATWTCVNIDLTKIATLSFGVVLGGSDQTGGRSIVTVSGGLAPQSTDTKPDTLAKAPVPRFSADTQNVTFIITP